LTSKCDLDLGSRELWTGHKINPLIDYANISPPCVTLTLVVGDQFLRTTHRLIIVNKCGKYLQNPFIDKKVMDRTQHIPSNRQCWPWMSKCDLDPGGRGLVVGHDTLSYYNKHLCQVISNSFDKWQSYGHGQTDGHTHKMVLMWLFLWSFWPFLVTQG
jgi:hypothetical protein